MATFTTPLEKYIDYLLDDYKRKDLVIEELRKEIERLGAELAELRTRQQFPHRLSLLRSPHCPPDCGAGLPYVAPERKSLFDYDRHCPALMHTGIMTPLFPRFPKSSGDVSDDCKKIRASVTQVGADSQVFQMHFPDDPLFPDDFENAFHERT